MARLHDLVEAGGGEGAVEVVGQAAQRLGLGRALAQLGQHRAGAGDDLGFGRARVLAPSM